MMRVSAVSLAGGLLIGLSTFQARVRLRRAPVPLRAPADADHARRRRRARRRPPVGRPRHGARRRGVLPRPAGRARADRRPRARRDHAALPALRGGGAGRGGRGAAAGPPSAARSRSGSGRASASARVGLAAEWGWSHVWMPIPWPSSCSRRPRCSASPRRSPAECSARGSARTWRSRRVRDSPRPARGAVARPRPCSRPCSASALLQAGRRGRPRGHVTLTDVSPPARAQGGRRRDARPGRTRRTTRSGSP